MIVVAIVNSEMQDMWAKAWESHDPGAATSCVEDQLPCWYRFWGWCEGPGRCCSGVKQWAFCRRGGRAISNQVSREKGLVIVYVCM